MNSASCSQVGCLGMFRVAIKLIEDLLCLNKTSSTAIILFTCDFIASGVWNVGLLSGDRDCPVSLFPSWTNGHQATPGPTRGHLCHRCGSTKGGLKKPGGGSQGQ